MFTPKSRLIVPIFVLASLCISTLRAAPVTFSVTFDASVRDQPATGRVLVYLLREKAPVEPMHQPADGFVEEDPQPIYGSDVASVKPGDQMLLDDSATSFPVKLSELPPGKYRAQAVLDMHHDSSDWHREPGNLFCEVVFFDITPPGATTAPVTVKLNLNHTVRERPIPETKSV